MWKIPVTARDVGIASGNLRRRVRAGRVLGLLQQDMISPRRPFVTWRTIRAVGLLQAALLSPRDRVPSRPLHDGCWMLTSRKPRDPHLMTRHESPVMWGAGGAGDPCRHQREADARAGMIEGSVKENTAYCGRSTEFPRFATAGGTVRRRKASWRRRRGGSYAANRGRRANMRRTCGDVPAQAGTSTHTCRTVPACGLHRRHFFGRRDVYTGRLVVATRCLRFPPVRWVRTCSTPDVLRPSCLSNVS